MPRISRPSGAFFSTVTNGAILLLVSMLTGLSALFAQTASTSAGAASKSDLIVLSPFEVHTDKDTGFAANSALAGGRLNTDLKDTPVAYSVINRDFIDALGLTDLNSALDWTTNSFKFWDGQGGGATFNITSPNNTRGISGTYNLRQRNFFIYFAPMDSYSIERYDFGRGPNQVLFGNGTVGGQSVTMTKRARFDRPFETLDTSLGSWDHRREVIDINRPINDRIALRAAAVWDNSSGWRKNQMSKTEAAFLTTTFKLTKNTDLRIEGETGQSQERIPYAALQDQFGGWDGKTVFSGQMTDTMRAGTATTSSGTTLKNNGADQGVDRRGSNYFVFDPFGSKAIMNYQNDPITRGAGNAATTPVGNYLQVGSLSQATSGSSLLHTYDVPGNRFDNAIANSAFRLPGENFTNSPDAPTITQSYKDVQLSLDQRVGDSLFFEIAGDINRDFNLIHNIESSLINTYIDINKLLPNGASNPHYLQPYADGQYRDQLKPTHAQSVRAAVAYVKDFGKWGNYSVNLMTGLTHQFVGTYNDYLQTGTVTDHRAWANGSTYGVRVRQYWNDPHPYAPPTAPISFTDPIAGTTSTITPFWAPDATSFNSLNEVNNYFNYALGALNAKFFDGKLAVLAAERFDFGKQVVKYTLNSGDYPADWDGHTIYWRPAAPSDWSTLSYVPKDATGKATGVAQLAAARPRTNNSFGVPVAQAQSANDRFQDDYSPPEVQGRKWTPSVGTVAHILPWFSLSYNYAQAFAFNTSAAPDPNNALLPPVTGRGWDASARFTFFKNKLNFAVTQYSNIEYGNYIDPTSVTNNINSLYNASPVGVSTSNFGNSRGAGLISSVVRDTRTRISDGYEFEAVANITRGWRMLANVGLPKVWSKAYAPITRAYVASHGDVFKQVLQDAGGVVGSDGVAVLNPDTTKQGVNAQAAVNAYNNIYTNVASFLPDLQQGLTAPYNGNFFTDYTIQDGRLKGLRFGAGVNYRGKRVVGYRGSDTIVNPANPNAAIDDPSVDAHNTVTTGGYSLYTATLAYAWKFNNHREIDFNLVVNNLLDNRSIVYTDSNVALRPRNGDYTSPARQAVPNSFAYLAPISFNFTTSVKF